MCLIHSNNFADKGFEEMGPNDKTTCESRLAYTASEDSITACNGLGKLLNSVNVWAKHETLRRVKKYRIGRHRFYITGHHTECNYSVHFILVNKEEKDDQPDKKWFQDKVLQALSDPATRLIQPPDDSEEENA